MVKLALVARLRDGMPLSQTPVYLNENSEVVACYKQKRELFIRERSQEEPCHTPRCPSSLITTASRDGICYTTLCESQYPRKLAFNYLEDLQKELQKVDSRIFESFSEPYAFKRFDYVIGHIRKRYMDTKTQENLYKLNSDPRNELKITTEEFANIMRNCESSGYEKFVATRGSGLWQICAITRKHYEKQRKHLVLTQTGDCPQMDSNNDHCGGGCNPLVGRCHPE